MQLENPPENPCFGCGPRHPRGLHLSFFREGDAVKTTYTPKEDEIGWPGLIHTGLHFTVLFEASYWATLELTGKVHGASGTHQVTQDRLPRTSTPFTVEARLVGGDGIRTVAVSTREDGKVCARLEAGWKPVTRSSIARSGLKIPQYLLDDMDP